MPPSHGALHGVHVVELGDLAGAYCGKLLADMGATVLQNTRRANPSSPRMPPGLRYYAASKRRVTFRPAADPARLRALIARADVLIDSQPELGLDHDALCAAYPHLIIAVIRPFGSSGPYRGYRGSDLICQAAGGMVFVNGEADQPPLQGAGLQAYHAASIHAAIGIMLALLARRETGRGQWIDVSIQECVAACVEPVSSRFFTDGTVTQRQGTLHWTRHFRQTRCRDGYALLSTLGDWTTLIEWVKADGKAEDLLDPSWRDLHYRGEHAEHIFDVLDRWAASYSVADLVDAAQLRHLPFAAVQPIASLIDNPQLVARQFFVKGALRIRPGAPYRFSRFPLPSEPAPRRTVSPSPPRGDASTIARQPPRGGSPSLPPLGGVRVIDFTWVVAGPMATRILADHGAEVIKIEPLAAETANRRSGLFGNLNRGKRSIAINMEDPRGVALAKRLIEGADVVIDNFSPRVMRHWGMDYERLTRLRSDLIVVSMTGFGQTGPWRDLVSYGPTLQAMAGCSWLMRHEHDAPPTGWGFSYSDMAAGCMGALATLFALWHRRHSGEGQHVDLAQLECLIALLGPHLQRVTAATRPPVIDNRSQEMPSAPHGVYRCADRIESYPRERWCAIAVFDEADWRHFCAALEHPAWVQHTHFSTLRERIRHQRELDAHVAQWTRHLAAEDVMTRMQQHGVAAAVVADARDLCAADHHLHLGGYFDTITTPEGDVVTLDGSPVHLSAARTSPRPAPLLGEDTDAVLMELAGMTANEVAAFRDAKVVQ